MIYRVILKVSYYERWFEFESAKEAADFAEIILRHSVVNEDNTEKPMYVTIRVVDKEAEAAQKAEEDDDADA
jgi:hypothetical protein